MNHAEPVPYERHLRIIGTRNLRDIGGYPTRDGRRTRWRTVFRGDGLDRLPPPSQEALLDHGIRLVVDLRRADELEMHPNVFQASPRVRYLHVPVVDVDPAPRATSLSEVYRVILDEHPRQIADAIRAVASGANLPAVIHCAAGRDRTGIVVALLLAAVDVAPETIADDYGLTKLCYATRFPDETPESGSERRILVDDESSIVDCEPETMVETLRYLDDRYGGPAAYLLAAGLEGDDLLRLRDSVTEPIERVASDVSAYRAT